MVQTNKRLHPTGKGSPDAASNVTFTFDGKKMMGRAGDTLAAALIANGVRIVGRSFKLHRPRGVMGWGIEESNALVEIGAGKRHEPNVRATLQPIYEGLEARSQNAWPSVKWDVLGVLDRFQKLLPASFYYKTLMWPNWHLHERLVRPLAGLGTAPRVADEDNYQKRNARCDVLIVGAGPAGLVTANEIGAKGLQVILLDDQESLGGALHSERSRPDEPYGSAWVDRQMAQLRSLKNVRVLPRTTASGYYEQNFLVATERLTAHLARKADASSPRERLWRIRARHVVLATGALERPMVFPRNDLPGIMLASAARHYINRFGIAPGQRLLVVTNNDSAYSTAFDYHDARAGTVEIVDTRRRPSQSVVDAARGRGIPIHMGFAVRSAVGRRAVSAARISPHLGEGKLGDRTSVIACDVIAMSSGWSPTVHLFSQAGGSLKYDARQLCLVPEHCPQPVSVAGAVNGNFTTASCIAEARVVAFAVLSRLGFTTPPAAPAAACPIAIEPFWFTKDIETDMQWLDFQHDVKVSDVELAMRENFRSVEHVKRYTTGGMSVDQGKSSNFNILATMAELSGDSIEKVGTTKFRPPYAPVTLGAFACSRIGQTYSPWRCLPTHDLHRQLGAKFGDYGWKRPEYYPGAGEGVVEATLREVMAVRNGVGVFDGSPLGKIELRGPDAADFLNRVYVNNFSTLKVGAGRYGLMCNENGVLIDDGVIVRVDQNFFVAHATSGAVDRVFSWMEELLQCEWPELRVAVANVTTQWSNATVSGPRAREVVQSLVPDIDCTKDAFPHMQFRRGSIDGVPCRVLRASFTGDAAYEISVPARYAESLWSAVLEAGAPHGIAPYGIEALEVMRIEKGYLHIGSDTDGTTTPLDVGWRGVIDKKTGDFVGRRSLSRPAERGGDRLEFVGLEAEDARTRLPVGGHVIADASAKPPMDSHGYVTSSCFSPTLGKSIGLGIVRNGSSRLGEPVYVYSHGIVMLARIVATAHLDVKGERLHA